MRGYYPGEREHRERPPRPRQRRPVVDQPPPLPPPPPVERPPEVAPPAPVVPPPPVVPAPPAPKPPASAPPRAKSKERARPAKKKAPGRGRRIDWVIGIVLGIVLGISVVAGFLVFGSEDTIDSPSISKPAGGQAPEAAPATAPSAER